jgi:hypothetical protein
VKRKALVEQFNKAFDSMWYEDKTKNADEPIALEFSQFLI